MQSCATMMYQQFYFNAFKLFQTTKKLCEQRKMWRRMCGTTHTCMQFIRKTMKCTECIMFAICERKEKQWKKLIRQLSREYIKRHDVEQVTWLSIALFWDSFSLSRLDTPCIRIAWTHMWKMWMENFQCRMAELNSQRIRKARERKIRSRWLLFSIVRLHSSECCEGLREIWNKCKEMESIVTVHSRPVSLELRHSAITM